MRKIISKVLKFFKARSYYKSYRHYYYIQKLRNSDFSISHYNNVVENAKECNPINTDKQIISTIFNVNKIPYKTLKEEVGSPYHTIKNKKLKTTVLAYRSNLSKFKLIAEYHFYMDKLIFYRYRFPDLSAHEKEEITTILNTKYSPQSTEVNYSFKDEYNSIVEIQNVVIYQITYINGQNSEFQEQLNNWTNNNVAKKQDIETTRIQKLYDRL